MPIRHLVRPGECLVSLAIRYGFRSPDDLLAAPGNAQLGSDRPDPTVLAPGDVVEIPDREPKRVSKLTDHRHRFRATLPALELRLAVQDPSGSPRADVRYRLSVAGETFEGRTGSDGTIRHPIARHAESGTLAVWLPGHEECEPMEWQVALGELDPAGSRRGAQARLAALGLYRGPIDGRRSPRLRAAIHAFQLGQGLAATGQLDSLTAARLRRVHGH